MPLGTLSQNLGPKSETLAKYDDRLVGEHTARLQAATSSRDKFDDALEVLKADDRLKASDIIEIATRFTSASRRPSSRPAALSLIVKKMVEIERYNAKNAIASRSRPL